MTRKWTILLIALMVVALCFAVATTGLAGKCGKKEKDQTLTLDQLPPAVRATLEAQAQGCTIEEIEKETEDGNTVYSADIVKADGTKSEVKIAEDGTLLPPEVENKDEGTAGEQSGDKDDDEAGESADAD